MKFGYSAAAFFTRAWFCSYYLYVAPDSVGKIPTSRTEQDHAYAWFILPVCAHCTPHGLTYTLYNVHISAAGSFLSGLPLRLHAAHHHTGDCLFITTYAHNLSAITRGRPNYFTRAVATNDFSVRLTTRARTAAPVRRRTYLWFTPTCWCRAGTLRRPQPLTLLPHAFVNRLQATRVQVRWFC